MSVWGFPVETVLKLQSCPCAAVWADRPSQDLVSSAWATGEADWERCSLPPLQQELIGLQVLWQPWQSSNMTFRQLLPLLPKLAGTFWAELFVSCRMRMRRCTRGTSVLRPLRTTSTRPSCPKSCRWVCWQSVPSPYAEGWEFWAGGSSRSCIPPEQLLTSFSAPQVKNFGRSGRTKYTHLVDQDTTSFDSAWGQESAQNTKFFKQKAAGVRDVFERPSAKKRKST